MKLRPFTREDYYGFDPDKPDDAEPMICFDAMYQGHEVLVICDKNGLSIIWWLEEDHQSKHQTDVSYYLNCGFKTACWICQEGLVNTIPQSLIDVMEKIL